MQEAGSQKGLQVAATDWRLGMLTAVFGEVSGSTRRISLMGLSKCGGQASEEIGWLVRDGDDWKIHLDQRLEVLAPSLTMFDFLIPLIVSEIREEMATRDSYRTAKTLALVSPSSSADLRSVRPTNLALAILEVDLLLRLGSLATCSSPASGQILQSPCPSSSAVSSPTSRADECDCNPPRGNRREPVTASRLPQSC